MTSQDIRAHLPPLCPAFFGSTDGYARPTLAWLQGPFWDYFQKQLFDFSVGKWSVDWECRDFCDAYRVFAQIALADTPDKAASLNNIALGPFWFKPDASRGMPAGAGHAIIFALTELPEPVYIDPQTNLQWKLTDTEWQSAYFARC